MIVVDASVFAKLILDEPDSGTAGKLIADAMGAGETLLAPTLLVQETLQIGLRWSIPAETTLDFIETLRTGGFQMREPTRPEYELASKIAQFGDPRSGYPQLADSIYHAMAIVCGGFLLTADRRHAAKAASFGAVKLLADWKPD